ncbi:MAG TPA: hypothetical protein GX521_06800 [Firmicutes bacterium]|nr:hypothetical protein [Bacillota bacterium]
MFTLQNLFYPSLILVLVTFILLTVPRRTLRVLIPYGIVFGGLLETLYVWIFQDLLKIIHFQHLGVFECAGHPFFSALAWVLIIVFYLYFWPQGSPFLGYAYYFSWAVLATAFSQLVKHAGLFHYASWFFPFPMFLSYLLWFALPSWAAKPWKSQF